MVRHLGTISEMAPLGYHRFFSFLILPDSLRKYCTSQVSHFSKSRMQDEIMDLQTGTCKRMPLHEHREGKGEIKRDKRGKEEEAERDRGKSRDADNDETREESLLAKIDRSVIRE